MTSRWEAYLDQTLESLRVTRLSRELRATVAGNHAAQVHCAVPAGCRSVGWAVCLTLSMVSTQGPIAAVPLATEVGH